MSDAPALMHLTAKATSPIQPSQEGTTFGRGLVNGLLLSLPLWGLIAYAVSRVV